MSTIKRTRKRDYKKLNGPQKTGRMIQKIFARLNEDGDVVLSEGMIDAGPVRSSQPSLNIHDIKCITPGCPNTAHRNGPHGWLCSPCDVIDKK